MTALEADKGYDADWLRRALLIAQIFPLIPYRKIRGRNTPTMQEICLTFRLSRKRWMVEHAFAWLKRRCRRLMLRWERIAMIWSGFATLGLIYTWIGSGSSLLWIILADFRCKVWWQYQLS